MAIGKGGRIVASNQAVTLMMNLAVHLSASVYHDADQYRTLRLCWQKCAERLPQQSGLYLELEEDLHRYFAEVDMRAKARAGRVVSDTLAQLSYKRICASPVLEGRHG
jgi:hypothetical protein